MSGRNAAFPTGCCTADISNHTTNNVGAIDQNLRCHHCGYNLRGLQESGRCPECGRAVGESLADGPLREADPAWLRAVAEVVGFTALLLHAAWLAGRVPHVPTAARARRLAVACPASYAAMSVLGLIGSWALRADAAPGVTATLAVLVGLALLAFLAIWVLAALLLMSVRRLLRELATFAIHHWRPA